MTLHPNAGNATRNAGVYTPVSAILHHAGVEIKLKRPKGAKGRIVTDWLRSEDADAVIVAADKVSPEFGALLRTLLYTGLRLGEVLAWDGSDLNLDEGAGMDRRRRAGSNRTLSSDRTLSLHCGCYGVEKAVGAFSASTKADTLSTC